MNPEYIHADFLGWVPHNSERLFGHSIITSLPDSDDMNWEMTRWEKWFSLATRICFSTLDDRCPIIFYQTDRKKNGRWISKASILLKMAESSAVPLLWHKIALRHKVGTCDLYRPGYSHLMAFGKVKVGKPVPDVIEEGRFLYKDGMSLTATRVALGFVKRFSNKVCDPFCGRGTVTRLAASMGMEALGIDIDKKQIDFAKSETNHKEWNDILCPKKK